MELNEGIYTLLGLVLTGGVGAKIVQEIGLYIRNKNKNGIPNAIKKQQDIFKVLNEILGGTYCNRVLLLRVNNEKVIPKPGAQLHASIILEVYDGEIGSALESWQDVLLDEDYTNFLCELLIKKNLITTPNKGSILGNKYTAERVELSDVYLIGTSPGELVYLSTNYRVKIFDEYFEQPEYKEFMRDKLNRLRKLLELN